MKDGIAVKTEGIKSFWPPYYTEEIIDQSIKDILGDVGNFVKIEKNGNLAFTGNTQQGIKATVVLNKETNNVITAYPEANKKK